MASPTVARSRAGRSSQGSALAVEVPKTAHMYLRISRDREKDELGVQRQRDALRKLIAERGWVLGREFSDDDQSAFKGKRRDGSVALLESIAAGDCDVVRCSEMSRLTRHPRELEDLVDLIERTGVQVAALLDLSTSGGWANARILGVMARHESEQMGERIKSKLAANTAAGKASGGPRPFGYQRKNGKLVVDKHEAKLIREWTAHVLAGGSVSSIVTRLNAEGVPTVRGGRTRLNAEGEPKRGPTRWTGPTVVQILTSPRIIGMTSSAGEPVAPAKWDKIIELADWEAVQGVLASRKRGPTPRVSLLASLLWCGVCGTRLYGAARGPKRPRQYQCQKVHGGCGKVSVAAHVIDEYVVGVVLERASGANLSLVRAERHVKDSHKLVEEVATDELELRRWAEDLGERRVSRAEWMSARGPIEKRLNENRAALKELGHGDQLPAGLAVVDDAKWAGLSFDQQRAVLRLFVDRVTVHPIGQQAGSKFRPERLDVQLKA
jgi:site-specific DNA recombinase